MTGNGAAADRRTLRTNTHRNRPIYTHWFDGQFSGEPGLVSCFLDCFSPFFQTHESFRDGPKLFTSSLGPSHHVLLSNSVNLRHCTTFDPINVTFTVYIYKLSQSTCLITKLTGSNRINGTHRRFSGAIANNSILTITISLTLTITPTLTQP